MQRISGYYWGKLEWDTQQNFKGNLKQKKVLKKYLHMPKHKQKNPINTEIIAQLKGFTIFTALTNPQV